MMSIVIDNVCCSLLFSCQQLTRKVERNVVWTGMKLSMLPEE